MKRTLLIIKARILHAYMVWKHVHYLPWFKRHKNSWGFRFIERCPLFPWYGKRVVYVKSKDPSTLTDSQKLIKMAIDNKEYQKALDIINSIPQTKHTIALKQIIEVKMNSK